MVDFKKHLISKTASVREALEKLNVLASDAILFAVDDRNVLIGSLTDGDVRRGLLKGFTLETCVEELVQKNPKYVNKRNFSIYDIIAYRDKGYRIIPIVNDKKEIKAVLNFRFNKSYLPVEAVIMAGGKGERLKPLTESVPKPLLKVGDKAIIEHNVDQLIDYGIDDVSISVRYLGEQIESYFRDVSKKSINIKYIWEDSPMGTLGAVSKVHNLSHEDILVINSDLLTNINYEDFYIDFKNKDAMLSIVTIPYLVDVPYAVLETKADQVFSLKEKPTFTYYVNGGIYLMKKACMEHIPADTFYNTTDLISLLISLGEKVTSYPLRGYWLDIGRHEDYIKAQEDIKHIKFN